MGEGGCVGVYVCVAVKVCKLVVINAYINFNFLFLLFCFGSCSLIDTLCFVQENWGKGTQTTS